MTYKPKTNAEWVFRWSVKASRAGNRKQKNWKHCWWCDWEDFLDYRRRILDRIHEHEIRNWEDYT